MMIFFTYFEIRVVTLLQTKMNKYLLLFVLICNIYSQQMPGFPGPGPFLPDGNGPPGSGIPYNPPNGDDGLFPNNFPNPAVPKIQVN